MEPTDISDEQLSELTKLTKLCKELDVVFNGVSPQAMGAVLSTYVGALIARCYHKEDRDGMLKLHFRSVTLSMRAYAVDEAARKKSAH